MRLIAILLCVFLIACGPLAISGHLADGTTTIYSLNYCNFVETNPILGETPEDGEVLGYIFITGVGMFLLSSVAPVLVFSVWGAVEWGYVFRNLSLIEDYCYD